MMQRISIVLLITICLSTGDYSRRVTARTKEPNPQPMTMQTNVTQVLTRAGVFRRDFPTVLAFLESWNRINEPRIYVFPDRVVGSTQYRTREEAQRAAAQLTEAMRAARSRPKAEAADLLRGAAAQPDLLRVDVIRFLPDDDSFHVAWVNPSLQLLTPNVNVATIQQRLGQPEKTTPELIQNESERRPVVLTLHSYAGGSIVFAESDWSPVPRTVDRVIIDVRTTTAALF